MYSFHTVKKMLSRCSVYWIMYACVLGVQISQDLSWDPNTSGSIKQAQQSQRFLRSWNKPLSLSLSLCWSPQDLFIDVWLRASCISTWQPAAECLAKAEDRKGGGEGHGRLPSPLPHWKPHTLSTIRHTFRVILHTLPYFLYLHRNPEWSNIRDLRPVLLAHDSERLPRVFVSTRLYNCNSSRTCLYKMSLNRLQIGQNAAARVLSKTSSRFHIAPILPTLHCLPVKFIIYSKKKNLKSKKKKFIHLLGFAWPGTRWHQRFANSSQACRTH